MGYEKIDLFSSAHVFFRKLGRKIYFEKKISDIRQKQKGEYDEKNLLQSLDLFDFEEYLFGENYIKVSGDEWEDVVRFKERKSDELISFFSEGTFTVSKPHSLWQDTFNQYIDIKLEEIQLDMKLIREGRNRVSHNKEITESVYQDLLKKLKLYINRLEEAFQKILTGSIDSDELSNMADDFVGYIENQWQGADLSGITRLSETVAKTMASQKALMQGADLSGITRLSETVAKTMASQRALMQGADLSGITRLSETVAKTMASQRALMQGVDFQNSDIQIEQEETTKDIEDGNDE